MTARGDDARNKLRAHVESLSMNMGGSLRRRVLVTRAALATTDSKPLADD